MYDIKKLCSKFNTITKTQNIINKDLNNLINNISKQNDSKESREFKYKFYKGYELTYQIENDKYHDLINSFSSAYLSMSRSLYVGENLPKDYLDNIDELYALFVLSFLFKYELEYIWENRHQINFIMALINNSNFN